jgi:hypothetical protein
MHLSRRLQVLFGHLLHSEWTPWIDNSLYGTYLIGVSGAVITPTTGWRLILLTKFPSWEGARGPCGCRGCVIHAERTHPYTPFKRGIAQSTASFNLPNTCCDNTDHRLSTLRPITTFPYWSRSINRPKISQAFSLSINNIVPLLTMLTVKINDFQRFIVLLSWSLLFLQPLEPKPYYEKIFTNYYSCGYSCI